jgi:tetratricopeptide (TPR) repeat protein
MPIPGSRSVVLMTVVCVLMSGQVPLFAQTPGQTVEKALALKRAGSTPQAIRLLDEYLASNPADGRAHYLMAWCLRDMGLGDAGRHFQLAVAWNITGADLEEAQAALKRMGVTVSLALPGDVVPGKTDGRSAEAPAASSEQSGTRQPPDRVSTPSPEVSLLGVSMPPWVAGIALLLLVLGVLSVILLACGAIALVGDAVGGLVGRVKRIGRTVGDTVSAVGTFAGAAAFLVACYLVVGYLGNAVLGHQHNSGSKASRAAAVATSRQALQGAAQARPTTELQPQQTGGDSADALWNRAMSLEKSAAQDPTLWNEAKTAWEQVADAMQREGRQNLQIEAMVHKEKCIGAYANTVATQGGPVGGPQRQAEADQGGEQGRIQGWVDRERELARQCREAGKLREAAEHEQLASDYESGRNRPFGTAMQPMTGEANLNPQIRGWVAPPSEEAARSQMQGP